jgi:hypothetical protein
MTEPMLLKDELGDHAARRILGSARDDAPGPGAREALLAALGVPALTPQAPSAPPAVLGAGATKASLAKWLVVGALGAAAAGAIFGRTCGQLRPLPTPSIAPTAPTVPDVAPVPAARPLDTPAPAPEAEPLATTSAPRAPEAKGIARPRSRRQNDVAPAAAPGLPSSLSLELRALEPARRAIRAGDAAAALEALDGYAARFPAGVLAQEATVLRIEALLARGDAGDRARAERWADELAARYPDSPHVVRARHLLRGADP